MSVLQRCPLRESRLYVDISIAILVLCQSRNQPIYCPSGVFLLVFLLLVMIASVVCWQCISQPLVKYQWCISRQSALLVHFFITFVPKSFSFVTRYLQNDMGGHSLLQISAEVDKRLISY